MLRITCIEDRTEKNAFKYEEQTVSAQVITVGWSCMLNSLAQVELWHECSECVVSTPLNNLQKFFHLQRLFLS